MDIERGLRGDSDPLERRLWWACRLFEAKTATPFVEEPQLIEGNISLAYPDSQKIEVGKVPVRASFRGALKQLGHEESHLANEDRATTDENQRRADEDADKLVAILADLSPANIYGYRLRRPPIGAKAQTQLMINEIIYGTGDNQRLREHSRELARIEADNWHTLTPQEVIGNYQWELYHLCKGRMSFTAAKGPAIELTVDDHRLGWKWTDVNFNYDPVVEEEIYQEAQEYKREFQELLRQQEILGVEGE